MAEYTYVLYFHIDHAPYDDEIIILGSCKDQFDLYYFVFVGDEQAPENKQIISVWKNLVETELNVKQKMELNDSLKHMRETEYSYTIGKMTLYLKKIQSFD